MKSFYKLINDIISKLKGEKFEIDNRIPIAYLLSVIFSKFFCLVYGMVSFRSTKFVYRNLHTTIKCKSKFNFGTNILINPHVYIDSLSINGIQLGNNVSIGFGSFIIGSGSIRQLGKGIKIGNNVGLGTHGFYGGAGGVEIGDDTIFGNYVSVHPENHNYEDLNTPIRLQGVNHKGIKIGKGCWIGAKTTILDGADIGDGCIVAAGAVVRGKFPPNSIIGGVPAKIIKMRDNHN